MFPWNLGVLYTQCFICWCCSSHCCWSEFLNMLRYVKKDDCLSFSHNCISCLHCGFSDKLIGFYKPIDSVKKVLSVLKLALSVRKIMKECHLWIEMLGHNLQLVYSALPAQLSVCMVHICIFCLLHRLQLKGRPCGQKGPKGCWVAVLIGPLITHIHNVCRIFSTGAKTGFRQLQCWTTPCAESVIVRSGYNKALKWCWKQSLLPCSLPASLTHLFTCGYTW